MLRIQQIKLRPDHREEELLAEIAGILKVKPSAFTYTIRKRSIDARKKDNIKYVYAVDVRLVNDSKEHKYAKLKNVVAVQEKPYVFPAAGIPKQTGRPVVVGSGPAGLFCAYMLAAHGFAPLLLERGAAIEERRQKVDHFWNTGQLDLETNVQFGEGGAGTFSDGKLNTTVKDPFGRNRKVLEVFVSMGAPSEILWQNKPHIGTDILSHVVKNMRSEIECMGGEVRFGSKMTDIVIENNQLAGVEVNGTEFISTSQLVLAIGHSARDTFEMLERRGIPMDAKSFAVGVRIEHPQAMIQTEQYGSVWAEKLPPADYKVTSNLANGRSVYSFCMCPGGYVVNASSEYGHLAVNGMSYHNRDSRNANSAVIVSVTPADFPDGGALAGIEFQRRLEQAACQQAGGKIPVQRFDDFCSGRASTAYGEILPVVKGSAELSSVRELFPEQLAASLAEGIRSFGRQIPGFDRPDALLLGVESRTSSPVRIWRDKLLESQVKGIYPCGEGAGYAGGITSAAMDGIKTAEKIAERFTL